MVCTKIIDYMNWWNYDSDTLKPRAIQEKYSITLFTNFTYKVILGQVCSSGEGT